MRLVRFKEACAKFGEQAKELPSTDDIIDKSMDKSQLENAKFMMKYLDHANG